MDPPGTRYVADRAVKLLMDFRYRLTGRLVLAVHKVERVRGLIPIYYKSKIMQVLNAIMMLF